MRGFWGQGLLRDARALRQCKVVPCPSPPSSALLRGWQPLLTFTPSLLGNHSLRALGDQGVAACDIWKAELLPSVLTLQGPSRILDNQYLASVSELSQLPSCPRQGGAQRTLQRQRAGRPQPHSPADAGPVSSAQVSTTRAKAGARRGGRGQGRIAWAAGTPGSREGGLGTASALWAGGRSLSWGGEVRTRLRAASRGGGGSPSAPTHRLS